MSLAAYTSGRPQVELVDDSPDTGVEGLRLRQALTAHEVMVQTIRQSALAFEKRIGAELSTDGTSVLNSTSSSGLGEAAHRFAAVEQENLRLKDLLLAERQMNAATQAELCDGSRQLTH